MKDIEDFRRRAGLRWQAIERPAREGGPAGDAGPRGPAPVGSPGRPWLRLLGIGVLLPVIVVVALVVNRSSGNRTVPAGSGGIGPVPVASPPLLSGLPPSTPAVQIAAGMAGGSAWSLWVKISPLSARPPARGAPGTQPLPGFGPGLDMEVVTGDISGGGGGDPTRMGSLVSSTFGPTPGFTSELVYGVTSARAAAVQILFSGSGAALRAPLYRDPRFPGLRFYAAVAPEPALATPSGDRIVAEALAADGTPLVQTVARPAPNPAT